MRATAQRVTRSLGLPPPARLPQVPLLGGRPVPLHPINDWRAPFRHRLAPVAAPPPIDDEPTVPWRAPTRCDAARATRPIALDGGGVPLAVHP